MEKGLRGLKQLFELACVLNGYFMLMGPKKGETVVNGCPDKRQPALVKSPGVC